MNFLSSCMGVVLTALLVVVRVEAANEAPKIACARYDPGKDLVALRYSIASAALVAVAQVHDKQQPTDVFPFYCFEVLASSPSSATSSSSSCLPDTSATKRLVKAGHVALLNNSSASAAGTTSVRMVWAGDIRVQTTTEATSLSNVLGTELDTLGFSLVIGLSVLGLILIFFVVRCCIAKQRSSMRASKYFAQSTQPPAPGAIPGRDTAALLGDEEDDDVTFGDLNSKVLNPIPSDLTAPSMPIRITLPLFGVHEEVVRRMERELQLHSMADLQGLGLEQLDDLLTQVDCLPAERQRIHIAVSG